MQIKLLGENGSFTENEVEVPDTVFDRPYNEPLVHQLIIAYQANSRRGTRAQKDRSMVRHSTKKPYRQKGTGRARAGMTSSPIWRGGGRVFPNSPEENFTQKINKKMYRLGMACILSQLVRDERLYVVENLQLEKPKTKLLHDKLKSMQLPSVLLMADTVSQNLQLASRNLPYVHTTEPRYADPVSLIRYEKVLLTKKAIEILGGMFV
jgi:large subunit ribosomal protein L4